MVLVLRQGPYKANAVDGSGSGNSLKYTKTHICFSFFFLFTYTMYIYIYTHTHFFWTWKWKLFGKETWCIHSDNKGHVQVYCKAPCSFEEELEEDQLLRPNQDVFSLEMNMVMKGTYMNTHVLDLWALGWQSRFFFQTFRPPNEVASIYITNRRYHFSVSGWSRNKAQVVF